MRTLLLFFVLVASRCIALELYAFGFCVALDVALDLNESEM